MAPQHNSSSLMKIHITLIRRDYYNMVLNESSKYKPRMNELPAIIDGR